MKIVYDANQTAQEGLDSVTMPSRIKSLVVTRYDGSEDVVVSDFVAQGDLSRTFVMGTNSFLASGTGGDGYAALAAGNHLVDSEIGEQQVMADYIQEALAGSVDIQDPPADFRVVLLDD